MAFVETLSRRSFGALMLGGLAACAEPPKPPTEEPPADAFVTRFMQGYGPIWDSGYALPGIPEEYLQGENRRVMGIYQGEQKPGTIDVDPYAKFLYLVREGDQSVRFPIGVGREGRSFRGDGVIRDKKKWPGWQPTANMLRSEPDVYGAFARGIRGGQRSPLGARALYLYRGGQDTHYRIHGTNDYTSIGNSGSAGCIRLFNQDIILLYDITDLNTPVHVRSEEESKRIDPENFGRGVEMPAVHVDPKLIYGDEAVAADPPPVFDDPRNGQPVTIYPPPPAAPKS